MKKIILMVSLAVLALVSCNRDDVVDTNYGSRIEFRTAVDTRAAEIMQNDLNEFFVTALYEDGTVYFSEKFTREGNLFVSANQYYWPSDENLTFYAYYPCDDEFNENVNISSEGAFIEDFTPNGSISDQFDFISAVKVTNKKESSNGVAIEFKHQLSQIEVRAKNSNEGYTVKVNALRIKNIALSGDFNFVAPMSNWTADGVLTSYEVDCGEVEVTATSKTLMGEGANAMLIPQSRLAWGPELVTDETSDGEVSGIDNSDSEQGENLQDEDSTAPETSTDGVYIALHIQVNAASGSRIFPITDDDYGWVAVPLEIKWNAGYKYTYVCDFSEGLGVIAPDQVDPDDPDSPYNPGDSVVGGKIDVDVSFGSWWTYESYHYPMNVE